MPTVFMLDKKFYLKCIGLVNTYRLVQILTEMYWSRRYLSIDVKCIGLVNTYRLIQKKWPRPL